MNNNLNIENNELKIIDNLNDHNWNIYNEKKQLLNFFMYIYDEFKEYILDIENKIDNINTKINNYEYIYIKENINNYSINVLNIINNLKEIINNYEESITIYKLKNYINYFNISNILNEIHILQEHINNNNKLKNRIKRWKNNNNDTKLFERNLQNILSKSNN